MTTHVTQESTNNEIGITLKRIITQKAEPMIQKALGEMEQELREKVAEFAVGLIQNDYVIERLGTDLRILIREGANGRPSK